jgi:O-antigen/teichoic acid export membrane protein
MFDQVAARSSQGKPSGRVLAASALAVASIAVVIVLVFTLAPEIVLWPFGSGFTQAAQYLPFFGLAMTMLSLGNLLVNYLVAIHDARFVPIVLLADVAEVILITFFHRDLWTVIAIVFGVTTMTLLALLAVLLIGFRSRF